MTSFSGRRWKGASFPIVLTSRRSRRGVMLLIVTLVLVALTLSGAALLTLMKTESEATTTRGNEALVKSVDRAAVVFLIGTLETSRDEQDKIGGIYNNPKYFCAVPLLTSEETGDVSSRFTIVAPDFTDSKIEGLRYGLVDESSRLNLEAVLAWDQEQPGAGRAALMKLPGMTQTAADSILDWIDSDEKARANGAEAKYYADKKLPYSPRNAVPVFLEELLLARGVTRSQLYGSDESFTYNVDKLQKKNDSGLGGSLFSTPISSRDSDVENVPWKELITVFSAEKDVDPSGEARVDLNGNDLQFLYRELQTRVGDELAKFVTLYRQYGAEKTNDDDSSNVGSNSSRGNERSSRRRSGYSSSASSLASPASTESNLTKGTLADVQLDYSAPPTTDLQSPLDLVGARVVVGDVVYESPIKDSRSTANAEKLFQLLDYASTNESTTIVGRVNVNVAPRAVLNALPNLATTDVQKIIDGRPDPDKTLPGDYRHASWLYTKGLVDLSTMRKLYNKTTARGDVYRGQIVGFLDNSTETSRADVVVDGTTEPPRQVFYKDLTTLGKGFSDSVLIGDSIIASDSSSDAQESNGVDQAPGLFEIENEKRTGYAFGNANDGTDLKLNGGTDALLQSDPFASVDLGTGKNSTSGAPKQNINVGATPEPGVLTDASKANATSPLGVGVSASTEVDETVPLPESTQELSRKQKLLNTLRSQREARQAKYGDVTTQSTDQTTERD